MPHEFASRARRYAQLDQRLASQTRFFAAAAVTNAALAQLCAHRLRPVCVSDSTLAFLSSTGCFLESRNLRWAERIQRSNPAAHVDRRLVVMEQLLLERVLLGARMAYAEQYDGFVQQVDRMLGWLTRGVPLPRSPSLCAFTEVLQSVAGDIGRPASFAICDDRIRIGYSLIRYLRAKYADPGQLAARFMLHTRTC